ncbi:DUF2848 domain-containing protein [Plantactinospora mayteni]|uniref:DUF2848 domain-containing protein n=1 Tax=Plantactinospora mayteni TaxID=566021 RepID=A0ABQ4ERE0_9ACTN|nr:DUF2848 family protein [Plantactinospora mayteni]GIG97190.1 hypothetical protein Pma05_37630 [Plantactinospora mayteni]
MPGGAEPRLWVVGAAGQVPLAPRRLVVAGYTGRDEAAVRAHIDELAAAGIAPPPTVPTFYPLDPALVTTAPVVGIGGANTSGEVEPVLVRAAGRWYLGVGSDHTDRELERADIARSKAACPKPVGDQVIPLPGGPETLDWDDVSASSEVDGRRYQAGRLAALRTPGDLWRRTVDALGDPGDDLVLFGGTLPLLDGHFVTGRSWQVRLALPDGRTLTHTYQTSDRSDPCVPDPTTSPR